MQGYNHSNKYRFKYSLRPESFLRSVAAGKTAWELACTVDCMKYAICTSFSPSNSLLKCTLLVKCNNLYEQRARSTVWELVQSLHCSVLSAACNGAFKRTRSPLEHEASLSGGQYLRNITGNCKQTCPEN